MGFSFDRIAGVIGRLSRMNLFIPRSTSGSEEFFLFSASIFWSAPRSAIRKRRWNKKRWLQGDKSAHPKRSYFFW